MKNTRVDNLRKLLATYPSDARMFRTPQLKPDGGTRPIVKPNKSLNRWLKQVKRELRGVRKDWPTFIHGGVRKRSYVSFARPHTNKQTVITLDIRDCFGSIRQKQVTQALVTKLALPEDLAKGLAKKLCVDGKISQGFATSNFLTNLYLNDTLLTINRELRKHHVDMSIYVDDIAISGNRVDSAEIINIVCTELSHAQLAIKKAKVKVMHSHARQVVVGLILNRGVAITREKRLEIFSGVSTKSMSEEAFKGWVANLNMFDKSLMNKFIKYAEAKGYKSALKKRDQ